MEESDKRKAIVANYVYENALKAAKDKWGKDVQATLQGLCLVLAYAETIQAGTMKSTDRNNKFLEYYQRNAANMCTSKMQTFFSEKIGPQLIYSKSISTRAT